MSTVAYFQQRLRALDADQYGRGPYDYENFAYDCRDAALQQAKAGHFGEAFRIINVILSEGIESENDTLWSDFYAGLVKAISVHQNITLEALKGEQRQLTLQNKKLSTATDFQQRLRAIDTNQYSRGSHDYENFAYDCRDAALQQAKAGHCGEAFRIINIILSEGIESENHTLWSDFYAGLVKAISVHQNITFETLRGDQRR